jgi:hypothetical protein
MILLLVSLALLAQATDDCILSRGSEFLGARQRREYNRMQDSVMTLMGEESIWRITAARTYRGPHRRSLVCFGVYAANADTGSPIFPLADGLIYAYLNKLFARTGTLQTSVDCAQTARDREFANRIVLYFVSIHMYAHGCFP